MGRERRREMAGMGSEICLGGRALRRVRWAFEGGEEDGEEEEGKTMPGESRSLSLLSSLTSRMVVVTPASAPTGQAVVVEERDEDAEPPRREVRVLMTEDLPTLG